MCRADALLEENTPLLTQQSIQDEMDATLSGKSLTSEQASLVKALISAKGIHAINGCPGARERHLLQNGTFRIAAQYNFEVLTNLRFIFYIYGNVFQCIIPPPSSC